MTIFNLKYNAYPTSLNLAPVKQNNNRLQWGFSKVYLSDVES